MWSPVREGTPRDEKTGQVQTPLSNSWWNDAQRWNSRTQQARETGKYVQVFSGGVNLNRSRKRTPVFY